MKKLSAKAIAEEFLALVIQGRVSEAFERYVDMNGTHHNIYTPAGFPALQRAMQENQELYPHKEFKIMHTVADGDIVMTHGQMRPKHSSPAMIVVHVFRLSDDKIVEMWDVAQPLAGTHVNRDGAFGELNPPK